MKTLTPLFGLLLTFLFFLFSCETEEPSALIPDLSDCHAKKNWKSDEIEDALIGEWNWEDSYCYSNPAGEDDAGLRIRFNSDNSLDLFENGQLTQSLSWQVLDEGNETFRLNVSPSIFQLEGYIFLCDDQVSFNSSFIDLCDTYYRRNN